MERSVEIDFTIYAAALSIVRGELKSAIKSEFDVVLIFVRESCADVNFPDAILSAILPPGVERFSRLGKMLGLIHDKKGSSVQADVSGVLEERNKTFDEFRIIRPKILLGNQDFMIRTVPAPRPVFVGPT